MPRITMTPFRATGPPTAANMRRTPVRRPRPDRAAPQDPYAWFNLLPDLMGDRPLSYYFNLALPIKQKYPYPGSTNVGSAVWYCPASNISPNDWAGSTSFLANGQYGLFCYVMDLVSS